MNFKLKFLFVISVITLLYSCKCDCDCKKQLKCSTIKAFLKANDSLVYKKTFCSQLDYQIDQNFNDSLVNVVFLYRDSKYKLEGKDTIIYNDEINKLDCDETKSYENNGYKCECSK